MTINWSHIFQLHLVLKLQFTKYIKIYTKLHRMIIVVKKTNIKYIIKNYTDKNIERVRVLIKNELQKRLKQL